MDSKYALTKRVKDFIEYWTVQDLKSTEGFLKSLDWFAGFVGVFYLVRIFMQKYAISDYFNDGVFHVHNWISFISNVGLPTFLILLFAAIYFFSRHSAKVELAIGKKLFPPGRVPDNWGGPKDRFRITLSVILFLLLYMALAWVADDIRFASLLMFSICCIDFRTRYQIGKGINECFSDRKYAPKLGDENREFIEARRAVARHYLFEKPHLWKEAARTAGCGIAFVAAIIGYIYDVGWLNSIAYVVLIVTLVWNEIIAYLWRANRRLSLRDIDDAEIKAHRRS